MFLQYSFVNYDADIEVSDTCVRNLRLSWVELNVLLQLSTKKMLSLLFYLLSLRTKCNTQKCGPLRCPWYPLRPLEILWCVPISLAVFSVTREKVVCIQQVKINMTSSAFELLQQNIHQTFNYSSLCMINLSTQTQADMQQIGGVPTTRRLTSALP